MKDTSTIRSIAATAAAGAWLLLAGCAGSPAEREGTPLPVAPDPLVAAPAQFALLHEGEVFRVLLRTVPAGSGIDVHAHPRHAAYHLTPGRLTATRTDGESLDVFLTAGGASIRPATAHRIDNPGSAETRSILFEMRAPVPVGPIPPGLDRLENAPERYRLLAEGGGLRVLEMRLPIGARDPMHAHGAEAVYFLRGGKIELTLPDGGKAQAEVADGAAISSPSATHAVRNIGRTEIHSIIVELR